MEFATNADNSLSEIEELRKELQVERQKRLQLEEDCDLLAVENFRLQEEIRALKEGQYNATISTVLQQDHNPFLVDGDGKYASVQKFAIENACGGKNVTCTIFLNRPNDSTFHIVCGGADNSVRLYDSQSKSQLWAANLSAPVLSMDSYENFVACSCMDGSHHLINFASLHDVIVLSFKEHGKYAICIRFSLDGKYLAVACHDQTVSLYQLLEQDYAIRSTIRLSTTPEAVLFVPSKDATVCGDSIWDLVIATRDRANIIYVDCNTLEQREVSLNVNSWDTHVSFTPLHLSLSPDMKYLLVSTNKGQHIIYDLHSNKRVRVLASHECNDYGKPSSSWDPTGKYVYSLSDCGYKVLIYSLASERVVGWLVGHHGAVRSVVCDPKTRQVVTGSFDKSVRVWCSVEYSAI